MTTPAPAPAPAPGSPGRLGNGQLRRQVAAWLDAHPGPHTPGEIAKALNRSAGATGNALTALADRGQAAREPGKPARFRVTATTATDFERDQIRTLGISVTTQDELSVSWDGFEPHSGPGDSSSRGFW